MTAVHAQDILTIQPSVLYFGTPVAIISTLCPDGRTNLSVLSSFWTLGDHLVLGLGQDGAGFMNLERERECVVNLPDTGMWPQVERLAPTTGSNPVPNEKKRQGYEFEADKFTRAWC